MGRRGQQLLGEVVICRWQKQGFVGCNSRGNPDYQSRQFLDASTGGKKSLVTVSIRGFKINEYDIMGSVNCL